MVAKGSQNKI